MKAVDTNVLVRLLTRDDPEQAATAAREMREGPIFLATTVLLETEWVLRHAYKFDRADIGRALLGLVNLAGAVVDDEAGVRAALRWHADGMDFADALHVAKLQPADEFITFDRACAKKAAKVGTPSTVRLLE